MTERLVIVSWVDTTNIAGWQTRDELKDFAENGAWKSQNVGWLVHEDDDCIVVAARRTEDGEHLGLAERIPRHSILRREDLD